MRVFFAFQIDPYISLDIVSWRDSHLLHQGTPVPMENFHVTLAFVGEIAVPEIENLCLLVDKWQEKPCFKGGVLALDRAGYWHQHGIFWLGPSTWPEHLTDLGDKLQSLATRVGGKGDRKAFQPHVTLLRHCDIAQEAPSTIPIFRVRYEEFTLFESRQSKRGITYHPLQSWDLAMRSV